MKNKEKLKKYTALLMLIIAGSAIYELPYIRYNYYDVMMEALQLNHTQMGNLMSMYGVFAMICYFPGGWLADRISCKKLLIFSLLATGAGGFYFATFPSYTISLAIHIFWAVTTTLTFWAAMIKATRLLGDSDEQGKLFGLLEGGRGLIPMIYGVAILAIFNALGAQILGFRAVVIGYSVVSVIAGLLVLFFIKEPPEEEAEPVQNLLHDILQVIRMPQVWLIAVIIFSSYVMYTCQSYITPYLTDMFGMSVSLAALIGLIRVYFIAIFAGPLGGVIADKVGSSTKILFWAFVIIAVSIGMYIVIPAAPQFVWPVIIAMVLLASAVFVTRGIYFATIDEIKTPLRLTGAAVGFASLIGYMPEAFIYTLIGRWLDNDPGVGGYKKMFVFMLLFAIIGILFCAMLYKTIKKQAKKQPLEDSNA